MLSNLRWAFSEDAKLNQYYETETLTQGLNNWWYEQENTNQYVWERSTHSKIES